MHIKTSVSYALAALALPIVFLTFMGNDYFSHQLVAATGIKVSPNFTGGDVLKTIDHTNYQTNIRQPVFAALFGESREGFIQIDWSPVDALPPVIAEEIDYDNDGQADFLLNYDTVNNTATVTPYNPKAGSVAGCYILKERRAVRINLRK